MGLFSKPKCPYCGGELKETNYAFPMPQYRCNNCIRNNETIRHNKELERRIKALEEKEII